MHRVLLLIGIIFLLAAIEDKLRVLDLKYFTIEVPKNWRYIPEQGIDSFVGEIKGPKIKLSFDCSNMGYASSLIQTPAEYIGRKVTTTYSNLFNEPGVMYTHEKHVEATKREEMRRLNTTDTSKVKVRSFIRPKTKIYQPEQKDLIKYPGADYLIDLVHNDSTITVGVTLPEEIRKHNFQIDTVDQYVIKTIWPKKTGNGMTGVYLSKLNSRFDLQMNARNLGEKQQADALRAFKTIKING